MRISDWSSDVCSSDLHATLAVLAADLVEPVGLLEVDELTQRHGRAGARRPLGKRDRYSADRIDILPGGVRHAHDDVETPVALQQDPGFLAAERRGYGFGELLDRPSATRNSGDRTRVEQENSGTDRAQQGG